MKQIFHILKNRSRKPLIVCHQHCLLSVTFINYNFFSAFQKTVKDKKVASEQRKQQRKSDATKEASPQKAAAADEAVEEVVTLDEEDD